MDNVQFDEDLQTRSFSTTNQNKMGAITKLFIKLGLAKDEKQANNAMVIVFVACLLLMVYFLISTFSPGLLSFKSKSVVQTTTEPWKPTNQVNQ